MNTEAVIDHKERRLPLDAKVEWIWEWEKPVDGSGPHHLQYVQLVRDGEMRKYMTDLGPIVAHPHWKQFNFWAGGEYNLGECLEIAERLRNNRDPEQYEPINLGLSYLGLLEEKHKRRLHRSTFGPFVRIERK